jgi:hypothetical protein
LSLGIQIHYSISSFYLILLIVIFIYKIKIPIKTIVVSLIIAGICLLPYGIYKQQTFILIGDRIKNFRQLKKFEDTKNIPVVAIRANAREEDI